MAKFDIVMPKLGESIIEATITKWMVSEGQQIEEDDALCELATDKVDSEIPSPVDGKVTKLLYEEGAIVPVGEVIAYVEMDGEEAEDDNTAEEQSKPEVKETTEDKAPIADSAPAKVVEATRFYSPLVKSIAKEENISMAELEKVSGTGKDGRLTKNDLLNYIKNRSDAPAAASSKPQATKTITPPTVLSGEGDQIIEMDRMRRLIADHMVMSKQVSPHVTSFIEVDMTRIWNWRSKIKNEFQKREGEKLTFTPIIVEASAKALKDFPGVNASVDGTNIILRKNINIGIAAALPDGNLIVPVIKNTDEKNLAGLAKSVNDLANKARTANLSPDDIAGGTFTITNFGTFGSLTGSPIINQPQVAILGVGVIQKKPAVIETPDGDMIGIRQKMILSLSYDHRVVDGGLGGQYLWAVKEYLENFDISRLS